MTQTDNQPTLREVEAEKKRLLRSISVQRIIHTDPYILEVELRTEAIANLTGGKA